MGRRGRIRVKGGLPLMADSGPAAAVAQLSAAAAQDGEGKTTGKEPARAALLVDVHGLEMRVRNVYTGVLLAAISCYEMSSCSHNLSRPLKIPYPVLIRINKTPCLDEAF